MQKNPPPEPASYEELFAFVTQIARDSYSDNREHAADITDKARAFVRRGPSSKPNAKVLKALRNAVADDCIRDRPDLATFLLRVATLHPALDAAVTDAAYPGAEGRVALPVADWGIALCFNWYSNEVRKHVVEWAYLS